MESFKIEGGHRLSGSITPQGAKNEALQVLCAVLLTDEKVTIHNIPNILDVNKLIGLLENLGVKIQKLGKGSYSFQADEINIDYLSTPEFAKQSQALRGSILIVGPLLARFGYTVTAQKLEGNDILLDEASVTGTANIVMAASLAKGTTTLYNAACEPYLQQLCKMLNQMGANIQGVGSNKLIIQGVDKLNGCTHQILPDMIEIGSWIGMAAMTQSELTIKDAGWEHLGIIPSVFERLGISLERRGEDIYIPSHTQGYEIQTFIDGSILTISDAPWPGFTPDLLSIILVTAIQARGEVLIHQKMFESRLFFVDKLIDMGAKIILCDPHRAVVIGNDFRSQLRATTMTSPDIRAGIALLIAALSAKGISTIHNIEQIDRGYERIEERLQAIGAKIMRA